jgi:PIN domain nuclease of toxin-antitoxin system
LRLLFDTQLYVWAAEGGGKLSAAAKALFSDPAVEPVYSPVSIWEVVIKAALNKPAFRAVPAEFAKGLRDLGYVELPMTTAHARAVRDLPPLHHDPFDRLLLAQEKVEQMTLVPADRMLSRYEAPIRQV